MIKKIKIDKLFFLDEYENVISEVSFEKNITLIHGASNTGKTLLVELISLILGGKKIDISDIKELHCSKFIGLHLTLNRKKHTLFRKITGSKVDLYQDHITNIIKNKIIKTENTSHTMSIITQNIGINTFDLLQNQSGVTKKATIADLKKLIISDEESIQSKSYPLSSPKYPKKELEKSLFRYFLTGKGYIKNTDLTNDNKSEISAKIKILNDIIPSIIDDEQINNNNNKIQSLNESISELRKKINNGSRQIDELVSKKKSTTIEINDLEYRISDISITLSSLDKLQAIYYSDIERLNAIEEASFYLDNTRIECSFCGSSHLESKIDFKLLQNASFSEIEKIDTQLIDLKDTIYELKKEEGNKKQKITVLKNELLNLNEFISKYEYNLSSIEEMLDDNLEQKYLILSKSENIRLRAIIEDKINNLEKTKNNNNNSIYFTEKVKIEKINEFCEIYKDVLISINFPNVKTIELNDSYDIILNGKKRSSNGKGVRSILNSVYKISICKFSYKYNIPYPTTLIFDTPLLAYRDSDNKKHGPLADDEKEIKNSNLSESFFNYLCELTEVSQFIILENIILPKINYEHISLHEFSGTKGLGRYGLLPPLD